MASVTRAIRRNKVRREMKLRGIRKISLNLERYFKSIRSGEIKLKGGGNVKHGKKPTVEQKKLIQGAGLDPKDWLVTKNTSDSISIVHRQTNEQRKIKKPA